MARLIDADAITKNTIVDFVGENGGFISHGDVLWLISKQPTIEAEPVKHGKWEEFDCEYGGIPTKGYVCSECGRTEANKEPYCHCGARMDGE